MLVPIIPHLLLLSMGLALTLGALPNTPHTLSFPFNWCVVLGPTFFLFVLNVRINFMKKVDPLLVEHGNSSCELHPVFVDFNVNFTQFLLRYHCGDVFHFGIWRCLS